MARSRSPSVLRRVRSTPSWPSRYSPRERISATSTRSCSTASERSPTKGVEAPDSGSIPARPTYPRFPTNPPFVLCGGSTPLRSVGIRRRELAIRPILNPPTGARTGAHSCRYRLVEPSSRRLRICARWFDSTRGHSRLGARSCLPSQHSGSARSAQETRRSVAALGRAGVERRLSSCMGGCGRPRK